MFRNTHTSCIIFSAGQHQLHHVLGRIPRYGRTSCPLLGWGRSRQGGPGVWPWAGLLAVPQYTQNPGAPQRRLLGYPSPTAQVWPEHALCLLRWVRGEIACRQIELSLKPMYFCRIQIWPLWTIKSGSRSLFWLKVARFMVESKSTRFHYTLCSKGYRSPSY
jgi:hypothetical protein